MSFDLVLPVLASLVAGGLIGFERDFRGHPAGLRTHALVCMASTVLMLAASRQGEWVSAPALGAEIVTDPTRMAHGILSGIGFLCAGVIFREGFSVHGLTTASTLWGTAAIGVLFGVQMYDLAIIASVAMLLVLASLQSLRTVLPRRSTADVTVRTARSLTFDKEVLKATLGDPRLRVVSNRHKVAGDGQIAEHCFRITSTGSVDSATLARRLSDAPDVIGYDIIAHDDPPS